MKTKHDLRNTINTRNSIRGQIEQLKINLRNLDIDIIQDLMERGRVDCLSIKWSVVNRMLARESKS